MNKSARKMRITQWIYWILLAFLLIGADYFYTNVILKERESFKVYAPSDMEDAFKVAFKLSKLDSDYDFVMTDNPDEANVSICYGTDADDTCSRVAFSPFVILYSANVDKIFLESDIVEENASYKGSYEINLSKLINVVITDKEWKDYGVEGFGKVKVAYPDPKTEYWHDFYDLMLIAANDGTYPIEIAEYNNAVLKLEAFFASDNAEAILDFKEKVFMSGGFTKDILYIGPEKLFFDINKNYQGNLFAPTETIYFNYYLKTDEVGSKILLYLDENDFK